MEHNIFLGDNIVRGTIMNAIERFLSFFNKKCFAIQVFHPHGNFRQKWDFAVCVIMFYIILDIPIQLCFEIDLPPFHPWSVADLCINIFFMIDILVNFNTGFFREGKLINLRREIAKEYAQVWLWLDVVTSIPFDHILVGVPNASAVSTMTKAVKIFRLFRILKMFRVLRLMNAMSKWQETDSGNVVIVRVSQYFALVLIVGHTCACFAVGVEQLYRSSDHSEENYRGYDPDSWFVRFQDTWLQPQLIIYLRAIYFSFTTLTTVGYGDITPLLPVEIVLTVVMQLLGTSMFGYLVGNLASMFTAEDEMAVMMQKKMQNVQHIIKSKQVPEALAARIKGHYEYAWKQSQLADEKFFFEELPLAVRTEYALFIHRDIINKVPMLNTLSAEVLPSLVARLKPLVAAQHDVLIKEGLFGKEMSFISKGIATLSFALKIQYQCETEIELQSFQQGDYFADYAIVLSQARHPATVTASSYCELFVLTQLDFLQFGEEFPLAVVQIMDICKVRFLELTKRINEARQRYIADSQFLNMLQGRHLSRLPTRGRDWWELHSIASGDPETESLGFNKLLERVSSVGNVLGQVSKRFNKNGPHSTINLPYERDCESSKVEVEMPLNDLDRLSPLLVLKISAWKNRAQLKIATQRLDDAKYRHKEKFGLHAFSHQRKHPSLSQKKNTTAEECSQVQKTPLAVDAELLERRIYSYIRESHDQLREEISQLRSLLLSTGERNTSSPTGGVSKFGC